MTSSYVIKNFFKSYGKNKGSLLAILRDKGYDIDKFRPELASLKNGFPHLLFMISEIWGQITFDFFAISDDTMINKYSGNEVSLREVHLTVPPVDAYKRYPGCTPRRVAEFWNHALSNKLHEESMPEESNQSLVTPVEKIKLELVAEPTPSNTIIITHTKEITKDDFGEMVSKEPELVGKLFDLIISNESVKTKFGELVRTEFPKYLYQENRYILFREVQTFEDAKHNILVAFHGEKDFKQKYKTATKFIQDKCRENEKFREVVKEYCKLNFPNKWFFGSEISNTLANKLVNKLLAKGGNGGMIQS